MFTGIIEELGKIEKIDSINGGKRIKISAKNIFDDLKINDSVAVNGVCLTVTSIEGNSFLVDAVGDTLEKTTFKYSPNIKEVNLERALRLKDRLGGHLVQGHVNGIANISGITKLGENYLLEFDLPSKLSRYLIDEGSIAVDGISLTIARLSGSRVGISVIPHTWQNTNLKFRKPGDKINIETDLIAKYIEKLTNSNNPSETPFTEEWLRKEGFDK